jgi:hypothetical protein
LGHRSGQGRRAATETKHWGAILVLRAVRVAILHLTIPASERKINAIRGASLKGNTYLRRGALINERSTYCPRGLLPTERLHDQTTVGWFSQKLTKLKISTDIFRKLKLHRRTALNMMEERG